MSIPQVSLVDVCVAQYQITRIRVNLQLKMASGQELVVLHTTPSMFSKFLVHAWS